MRMGIESLKKIAIKEPRNQVSIVNKITSLNRFG